MLVSISNPQEAFIAKDGSATEKADAIFKFICEKVIEYWSLDKNPRPYRDDWYDNKWNPVHTPAHTHSLNDISISLDLSKWEFPLLSLRPIAVRSSIWELLWIYQDQSNNLDTLADKYHVTWRDSRDIWDRTIWACYWETVRRHNLINNLLNQLEKDPDSRRHIISLRQDSDFENRHWLKPCVHKTQFIVRHDKSGIDYLDTKVDIRSRDFPTAWNINMMQYAVFAFLVARHCGYVPWSINYSIWNLQIYDRHIDNVKEMLNRKSIPANPEIIFETEETNFFKIPFEAIKIKWYSVKEIWETNPQLKFPVAI